MLACAERKLTQVKNTLCSHLNMQCYCSQFKCSQLNVFLFYGQKWCNNKNVHFRIIYNFGICSELKEEKNTNLSLSKIYQYSVFAWPDSEFVLNCLENIFLLQVCKAVLMIWTVPEALLRHYGKIHWRFTALGIYYKRNLIAQTNSLPYVNKLLWHCGASVLVSAVIISVLSQLVTTGSY